MKKQFVFIGLLLLGAGCVASNGPVSTPPDASAPAQMQEPAEAEQDIDRETMPEDPLAGVNEARVKINYDAGICPSAVMKVGTYTDADDVAQVALDILQKRNPLITEAYLEVDETPFMNGTTYPPTPSTEETIRELLRPDGSVEKYYVKSSQTTMVRIKADFYNTYHLGIENSPDCYGDQMIDDSCIGALEFTKGDVLMHIAYPC